jgi:hypothetical protein
MGLVIERALLLTTVLMLFTGVAYAQDEPGETEGEEADAEAQRLFGEGRSALEAERYDDAVDLFTRSFELRAHPPTAFNLAFALREAGRPTEALSWLDRIAEGEVGELDAEQTAELDAFRRETEARLGRVVISIDGAEAADILVDDVPSGRVRRGSELSRTVDPGEHVVVARSEGLEEERSEVMVAAGATETLRLTLRAPAAPDPEPPAAEPVVTVAGGNEDEMDDDDDGIPAWVWIVGGLIVAGAAVGLAVALTSSGAEDDALATVSVLTWGE